jgi:hypothetical protein
MGLGLETFAHRLETSAHRLRGYSATLPPCHPASVPPRFRENNCRALSGLRRRSEPPVPGADCAFSITLPVAANDTWHDSLSFRHLSPENGG